MRSKRSIINTDIAQAFIPSTTIFRYGKSYRWSVPPRATARVTAIPIRAITRKVSDYEKYHFPEGTDKDGARLFRKREKKAAKKQIERDRNTPKPIGFGASVLHVDNPMRTARERAARFDHFNPNPDMPELIDRSMFMLSGGEADNLLHLLRARYIERDMVRKSGKKVLLTDDIPHLYKGLVDEILHCDECYYADDPKPRIPDIQYDELITHLLELERCFPELITPNSPSQNIGHGAASRASKLGFDEEISDSPLHSLQSFNKTVSTSTKFFKPHRHQALMLSLDNAYSHDDMVSFVRRSSLAGSNVLAELKIDGVALSLEYQRGALVIAATRGTGRMGDNITENAIEALTDRGVVLNIPNEDGVTIPDNLIVRGEVYISPDDFKKINENLERPLSNPRNAAAGALKHKDKEEAKSRRLQFVAYECLTVENVRKEGNTEIGETLNTFESQEETLLQLKRWGFGSMPMFKVCNDIQNAEKFATEVEGVRSDLLMEIDGLVLKMNDSRIRESVGYTARAPRGAMAFKFASQSRKTELLDVVMQVSRQGIITPVAILNPVSIGGVAISRATLHNFEHVKRLKVCIGDIIRIERGGDVIPKVIGLEHRCDDSSKRRIVRPPSHCPSCGGDIEMKDEDSRNGIVQYVCKNGSTCSAQTLGRLIHFAGRNAMDIRGLGRKTAEKLVTSGYVIVMADLYRLTVSDLLSLEGFAEQSATMLLSSIKESASGTSLERLLAALGLPGVGRIGARSLALKVETIDNLVDIGSDESGIDVLQGIPNIAKRTAIALYEHLQKPQYKSELKAIAQLVKPIRIVDNEDDSTVDEERRIGSISGQSFAFTGKFSSMNRPEVMKWIRRHGGRIMSDVSGKTDFLICGLDPGNKLFKAQRLMRCIVQEEEFFQFFNIPSDLREELTSPSPSSKSKNNKKPISAVDNIEGNAP